MASVELLEAVAVTAELCGRVFSEPAARVFMQDLEPYPEPAVMKSLARCRREVRGILTVQDVVSRLDDGRPGAEEAWALIPMDEQASCVWTDEMAKAFAIAAPLLCERDRVAARMSFREAYSRLVSEARDAGVRVEWSPSLGHDSRGHEAVLLQAVRAGRVSLEYARGICPQIEPPAENVLAIGQRAFVAIGGV
jgi:hypothetical protein